MDFLNHGLSSLHFLVGNGTIEFEEFAAMMSKKIREKDTDDEIKTAFKAFDHSNKGFITGKLKSLHLSLTEYAEIFFNLKPVQFALLKFFKRWGYCKYFDN